jgi:hypothetical protein
MGIVTQVSTSPATYERNQAYLSWRRVQQLRSEYTTDELLDRLTGEAARDEDYAESFGVDAPDAVSLTAHAAETGQSVEEVWERLC